MPKLQQAFTCLNKQQWHFSAFNSARKCWCPSVSCYCHSHLQTGLCLCLFLPTHIPWLLHCLCSFNFISSASKGKADLLIYDGMHPNFIWSFGNRKYGGLLLTLGNLTGFFPQIGEQVLSKPRNPEKSAWTAALIIILITHSDKSRGLIFYQHNELPNSDIMQLPQQSSIGKKKVLFLTDEAGKSYVMASGAELFLR